MKGSLERRRYELRRAGGLKTLAVVRENPIRDKSFTLALKTIAVYKQLKASNEFVISRQLLKSGTSVGANVEEATAASSRRDFLYRITIASKEARETLYWLRLIAHSELLPGNDVAAELSLADELVRMLTAIAKTTAKSAD
jgi:four helix bundle protein